MKKLIGVFLFIKFGLRSSQKEKKERIMKGEIDKAVRYWFSYRSLGLKPGLLHMTFVKQRNQFLSAYI
jgi:hypothetical protein